VEIANIKTPIGIAKIVGDENGISKISVSDEGTISKIIPIILEEAVTQLNEYFEGKRTDFTLKLNPQGTEFQQKVLKGLVEIPFGKTRTYLERSKILGDVKAIRAVASANEKNPLWIVVPCHRVLGTDGSLTVMQEDYGAKNGCSNTKTQRRNKVCFDNLSQNLQVVF